MNEVKILKKSRIGKMPISLPKDVSVELREKFVEVKGPKGSMSLKVMNCIEVKVDKDVVLVDFVDKNLKNAKFHGLYRALINNFVKGVSEGFSKKLLLIGVGFRAFLEKIDGVEKLKLELGYSNPIIESIPEGISVKIEKNTEIVVSGIDKQLVGQFAANIRSKRPPEPYKGKGVRYEGEHVRRKAGKKGKK